MSTATKRSLHEAERDAKAFREYFRDDFHRWEIAGSVRRQMPMIGDIEHVVLPRFEMKQIVKPGDLFPTATLVNVVWERLDALVSSGIMQKHRYGETGQHRWGDLYRGVDYLGFTHEIFTADAKNLGSVLAIRTGPAEFSKRVVTVCQQHGVEQRDGYLRYIGGGIIDVPEEKLYLELCGIGWVEPKDRR